ncbi:cystathionine gamma-synthase [Isoptericola sp. CG 20/1183]|uniref:Cystathionine gamma-synthase n=1 Tax=Isoptericola halotolerans TaxID=300560 RepID=A0ABX5EC69_9MICO|nr:MULTISPECIES: aminotransferase class I/II-fold pyridoxal phosphate-dependent enzyme [Isoptericola]PRZ05169.1 cystathionine gamma-synthase [Isoptericola halotolerans]PRZ05907.1 cystathionine gamma-synthase [Isoptericola sp. CG 20/1183]
MTHEHAETVAPHSPATVAVTAGRPPRVQGGPVNAPVVLSSTYVSQGVPGSEQLYTRGGAETWEPFESALAALEGAAHGVVLGSGMAAVAAALGDLPPSGVVVVPRHAYQVTLGYLDDLTRRHGLEVRRVDVADTDAVVAALDGADLLMAESPTNPMLEVADLPAILAAARDRGVPSVVDNTFATPLGQRPLDLGADVVVHSVTKYLAGHSDVVLGAVVTNDDEAAARIRAYRTLHGAIAGPMEVFLALRGLRTLHLRVERANANAAELARRLADHPAVAEVRHPSLPSDPGHERAAAQMTSFGAIIGLRPVGGREAADAVVAAVRLWVPATSLGGVESALERRRRFTTESVTVPEDLIRMSVGVEDVEDLWADLARALDGLPA